MAEICEKFLSYDIEAVKRGIIQSNGMNDEIRKAPELFRLELVQVSCGDHAKPTATVTIRTPDGEELTEAANN